MEIISSRERPNLKLNLSLKKFFMWWVVPQHATRQMLMNRRNLTKPTRRQYWSLYSVCLMKFSSLSPACQQPKMLETNYRQHMRQRMSTMQCMVSLRSVFCVLFKHSLLVCWAFVLRGFLCVSVFLSQKMYENICIGLDEQSSSKQ